MRSSRRINGYIPAIIHFLLAGLAVYRLYSERLDPIQSWLFISTAILLGIMGIGFTLYAMGLIQWDRGNAKPTMNAPTREDKDGKPTGGGDM